MDASSLVGLLRWCAGLRFTSRSDNEFTLGEWIWGRGVVDDKLGLISILYAPILVFPEVMAHQSQNNA